MCAGMHLARIEMEILLEALIEAKVTLELGETVMGVNAGLYGFTRMELRLD
jgi:cytochrome P450